MDEDKIAGGATGIIATLAFSTVLAAQFGISGFLLVVE